MIDLSLESNLIHEWELTPRSAKPKVKTFTINEFRKCVGFLNTDKIQPHLKQTFQNNFHISHIDQEYVLNLGDVTTIDKVTSTKTVPLPYQFTDVIHIDIGYGYNSGIRGGKYCLFAVDQATRKKYIYPLTSLSADTLPAFHNLITNLGQNPQKIITNFVHKLMGKTVCNFLHKKGCTVESTPPKHQHQNELVEHNWRTLVRKAHSWLSSALLPSSFWFLAIKRACQVHNYLPVNVKGQITSPHELVHHIKPDM